VKVGGSRFFHRFTGSRNLRLSPVVLSSEQIDRPVP
jgi:hypothetical protein